MGALKDELIYLVVILHQLNNDPDIVRIILNRNDSHDVGSILSIGILTILVCQDETGVSLVDLKSAINQFKRLTYFSV